MIWQAPIFEMEMKPPASSPQCAVSEDARIDTGLLDANGNKITRERIVRPIGFIPQNAKER